MTTQNPGDTFQNGGINDITQVYPAAVTVNPTATNTLTNNADGVLEFTPPPATASNLYGNLNNYGSISYIPSSRGSGNTFNMGSNSSDTLINSGSITYSQLNATSGSSVYLQYGTITNQSGGTIDLSSAGASTISAPYVSNLTNAGTIKVTDTSGSGMTSNWGNGTGVFNNTGSFSIDDSAATSGSTTNLNFSGITNSSDGNISLNIPAASTAIIQVGNKGFDNEGTWSITSKNGGGNLQIIGGSSYTNTGTLNVTGVALVIQQPLSGSGGTVNLSHDANVTLNGNNTGSGQTFNFSGADNTLTVQNAASFTGIIRGFSQGDSLSLQGVTGTPTYDKTTGILTITNGTTTHTYDVGKGYTGTFSDNGGTVTYAGATPCFLAGSMIRTDDGEKAVENISVGDVLMAWNAATEADVAKPVVWVGSKTVVVNPSLPDDMAGYPVRILANALGDGVPYQDLLVTAEHCMFLDGRFVPARMLVNGHSIFFDRTLTSFEVYHVETAEHAVLTANGALSESFLNTENHGHWRQSGKVVSIGGHPSVTWDDAAAPLDVSREFVEPLFREFKARAIAAGIAQKDVAPELVEDADLHLVTDAGALIRPAREHNGRVIFMIPTGVKSVRIASHASRPSDVIGPFIDDRRYFGVAVGEITMFESSRTRVITTHLTDRELDGWNTLEGEDTRWTSGNALLPLGERHPNDVALMAIQIKKAGPYLARDTVTDRVALRA